MIELIYDFYGDSKPTVKEGWVDLDQDGALEHLNFKGDSYYYDEDYTNQTKVYGRYFINNQLFNIADFFA